MSNEKLKTITEKEALEKGYTYPIFIPCSASYIERSLTHKDFIKKGVSFAVVDLSKQKKSESFTIMRKQDFPTRRKNSC